MLTGWSMLGPIKYARANSNAVLLSNEFTNGGSLVNAVTLVNAFSSREFKTLTHSRALMCVSLISSSLFSLLLGVNGELPPCIAIDSPPRLPLTVPPRLPLTGGCAETSMFMLSFSLGSFLRLAILRIGLFLRLGAQVSLVNEARSLTASRGWLPLM